MPRNYLIVGDFCSGISTTANCFYNKSPIMKQLIAPFQTLDSNFPRNALNCELRTSSTGDVIIDAKGFNSSDVNSTDNDDIFRSIKQKLDRLDSLDCVIFVSRMGNFDEAIVKLISRVNNEFKQYCKCKSSILLITNCPKDWTQLERQKKNVFLQEALKLCDHKYIEFRIDLDDEYDEDAFKLMRQRHREKNIKTLLLKIESYFS